MPLERSDSLEKKTYGYQERDEELRQAFVERLQTKQPHQITYVDEAGIDNRDEYPYGYGPIGERVHALKSGKRTERVSFIAALKMGELFAPMTQPLFIRDVATGVPAAAIKGRRCDCH